MRIVTAGELAGLAGGNLVGDPDVQVGPDVVIDSRSASVGSLFVALPGERVDGHDYAARAIEAGAAAVLVARRLPVEVPQIVVAEPAQALARLATALVADAVGEGLVNIGITGSSGKTSTKDLIAQVVERAGATVAPVGSQNNEIGVPLTATRISPDTRYLVSELGARGQGHIAWLCGIVPPQVGVVVNVGHAHLGEFGSVAEIARAKGELVEALPATGWAVLNADDPLVSAMRSRTSARIATFGVAARPSFGELRVWAEQVSTDALQRPGFVLHADGVVQGSAPVQLQVLGAHQVANSLAAAAVGLVLGLEPEAVAAALGAAVAKSHWRMELLEGPDGLLIVNDSYNANPDSVAVALHTVAGLRRPGGRLIAVLGDMLELGPTAAEEHRRAGALAARTGIDLLVAIGDHAGDLVAGAGSVTEAVVVADRDEAIRLVTSRVASPDVVLVKASRGLALESVAERLAGGSSTREGER